MLRNSARPRGVLPVDNARILGNLGGAWSAQPVPASPRPPRVRRAPITGPPPRAYDAGVHLRPRLGPAHSPSAARDRAGYKHGLSFC